MSKKIFGATFLFFSVIACNNNQQSFDASGTFEADEVVVSAEVAGQLLAFDIQEGDSIPLNKIVGKIDTVSLVLQKEQVLASIKALGEKTTDINPQVLLLEKQVAVQQSELQNTLYETTRLENLFKQDAATGKQVDDIHAKADVQKKQIAVTQQQINVLRNNVATQNRSVLSETKPLEKKVAQLDEQISKANILNPVAGIVLTKYAEAGEFVPAGKALYEIANLSEMTLRAYISGDQLSQVGLGQQVKVRVDNGANAYKEFPGIISWIADKAEFTPKTIQTKDERANLVYAIKVKVKNDGFLKIGMYGEVILKTQP
ncbi:MAG: HlyD family efflux transporter periplasmic adaptor subunit [Bacteroidota bacterium]